MLHEGFVGVIGDSGVQEVTYPGIEKEPGKVLALKGDGGWLGFTDKYWASAIIPGQSEPVEARFSASGSVQPEDYQTDFLGPPSEVAPAAASRTSPICSPARKKCRPSTATRPAWASRNST